MNQDRLMQETVEDGSFFCFQGADFEVHPAKIIQTEVAFCKTEVKFAIYLCYLPPQFYLFGKSIILKNILQEKTTKYFENLLQK